MREDWREGGGRGVMPQGGVIENGITDGNTRLIALMVAEKRNRAT